MSELSGDSTNVERDALLDALQAVLQPLAQLMVARGVTFATVEERLKIAMVQAAQSASTGGLPHRLVSRISTATGINRREVTRLTREVRQLPAPRRSLANEVHAHWLTAPAYRDELGMPLRLLRTGPEPSFETLARAITNDVHPRSLMNEMVRLGYASFRADADVLEVVEDATTPKGNVPRLLEILGHNVGDHLAAAVANVLTDSTAHFEQAIVADGLSPEAVLQADRLVRAQWRRLLHALVPAIEGLVAASAAQSSGPLKRMTIGLFEYDITPPPAEAPAPEPPRTAE